MPRNRRPRAAFHPNLNSAALEERVVLSTLPGFTFVTPRQAVELRAGYARALRSTQFSVRTQIEAQAQQLFANGTPNAQQIANFEANAEGIAAAGASADANLLALLPRSQARLVPNAARAFLSSGPNSVISRIQNVVNNSNAMSSLATLDAAITNSVRTALGSVAPQTAQFIANQNLNNDVLFATNGAESLSQFMGDRIVSQFVNNLSNMALAVPTVANSVLFPNGVTTATAANVQQFDQMVTPALALTASNLGNELQLIPGGTTVIPALQNALFGTIASTTGTTGTGTGTIGTGTGTIGTGTGTIGIGTTTGTTIVPTNFIGVLQNLPTTSTDFAAALPTAFTTALGNVTNIMSQFLGTTPTPTFALNTAVTPSIFNSNLTGNTFQSGFLGGFGSGSLGFGVAPTTLNTNFGTGFNNFVSTVNPAMGFFTPPINTGNGVVGTVGVTTGPGTTIGTGTTTTGTGTGTTTNLG